RNPARRHLHPTRRLTHSYPIKPGPHPGQVHHARKGSPHYSFHPRAGQTPNECHTIATAPGGHANRKRATPITLVGSRKKSVPPST
ncbi:MAG: hypothetical protein ACSLE3_01230, partial [Microbacteriaceae bacterium]